VLSWPDRHAVRIEEQTMRIVFSLLAALAASAPAWGRIQGTAETTNLRYTLTDLTPADVTATAPTTLSRNWTPEVHVDASLGRLGVRTALDVDTAPDAFTRGGATATLYYRTASGAWSAPIVDGLFGSAGTSQAGVFPSSFDLTRTATVSWANTGDTWIEGHVIYDVGVSGEIQGGPAPVPEPAAWAMLAAGAGLLGAMARRQRI
jgi:hypothetical protein